MLSLAKWERLLTNENGGSGRYQTTPKMLNTTKWEFESAER